jgi:hypothetical protein
VIAVPLPHQENLKFYQDPAGIIQVFGGLWWSLVVYEDILLVYVGL